jgi:thiol-disulfide isomerase/thioredoxin
MGKAQRNRNLSARARIAEQQALARKAEQRRRLLAVAGAVAGVLVIVAAIFVVKGLTGSAKQGGTKALANSDFKGVTTVPAAVLNKVGPGTLPATGLPIKGITDTVLTSSGKPDMLYIGAEFCPYCAAMRWSMAVALSRFGSFGPFTGIHSNSSDVYPNTATLTFLHQKYSSKYLTFTPIENEDINHKTLQTPTKAQQALWVKYDSSNGGLGYPFIDFGGKVVLTGPLYSPAVLKGLTWSQISSELADPNGTVAKNVLGAANYVTAAICKMTNDTPSTVCKSGAIPSIEAKLAP